MRWLTLLLAVVAALPAFAEAPDELAAEDLPIVDGPDLLEFVEAPYPPEAAEQGLEAVVVLLVELDETGAVLSVEVTEPAGHGFDEAALEAVRQMRFGPARTEAGPVPVLFELPYHFALTPDVEDEVEVEAPVNLDGEVVQMPSRKPLSNARVTIEGTDLVAQTDAEGRFALRGVPPGPQVVRVFALGHVTIDSRVEIAEGEVLTSRFWLRPETYRDNEAVALYDVTQEEVTRRSVTIEEIRRVPGTFGDPIKVIQTLPGAARSPFGTGLLVIRGANPEDSGVYVDGVRLPIIYHLTGTTSVLSPEIIEGVDYLPGGFGAQYGRSMGGVIEVKTKDTFEDAKLVWGTDILDSQVYFEGNLGKNKQHGVAVGARRSYIDAFIPLFADDGFSIKPVYWDYQAKWVPKLENDQDFSVFVYGFQDTLSVSTPDDVTQGSDPANQGDLRTMYASQRIAVRYRKRFSDRLSLLVAPSFGIDYNDFSLGGEFRLASMNGVGQLRAELQWQATPALSITPGMDFIGGWYSFEFKSPFRLATLDDPLAEREGADTNGRGVAMGPDFYLKAQIRPLADRDRWQINPGVRMSSVVYTYGGALFDFDSQSRAWGQFDVDPRLSTRFAVTDAFLVKGAIGRYTQPPQPFQSIGFGRDVELTFERALNSSVGFEHRLTQAVKWDVELFHRHMDGLVVFNPAFDQFGDQNWINSGQGRAYGAEVIVRHAPVKRFFGWISYTLSKSERRNRPTQDWFPFDFDQTHILSAQGGYELPFGFDVSAQVQYVTGNPTSLYNAGVYDLDTDGYSGFRIGPPNADRLPSFLQTSIRLDKLWTFKRFQLDTYIELINLIRGVNPEFTLYAYDYSEYAYVRGLPFIPNLGFELRFWP